MARVQREEKLGCVRSQGPFVPPSPPHRHAGEEGVKVSSMLTGLYVNQLHPQSIARRGPVSHPSFWGDTAIEGRQCWPCVGSGRHQEASRKIKGRKPTHNTHKEPQTPACLWSTWALLPAVGLLSRQHWGDPGSCLGVETGLQRTSNSETCSFALLPLWSPRLFPHLEWGASFLF